MLLQGQVPPQEQVPSQEQMPLRGAGQQLAGNTFVFKDNMAQLNPDQEEARLALS